MANQVVREGHDGGSAAMATMSMTADTGNAYWQGKVNLPLAMAKKKIRVEGNVASCSNLPRSVRSSTRATSIASRMTAATTCWYRGLQRVSGTHAAADPSRPAVILAGSRPDPDLR